MKLAQTTQIIDFNPFETRTEAGATHNLGESIQSADMRAFRFAKVGASNVSKGKLQVAPAPSTNHHNIAVAAPAAAGATQVTVTLGATAAVANEYSEGYLCISDVDGEGQTYQISGHPAANSSASLVVTLFDKIATALTTSSEVCLIPNTYNGIVEAAVEEREPAGIPLISLSAGDYGWVQTNGVASALSGEDYDIGSSLTQHASTAGALDETDTTFGTAMLHYVVGKARVAGINTEYRPVSLTID